MTSPTTQAQAREAVELPELPYLSAFHPIWRAVINWSDAADGPEAGAAADVFDAAVKEYVKAYARPLLAAKQEELDKMRADFGLIAEVTATRPSLAAGALANIRDIANRHAALSPTQGETN